MHCGILCLLLARICLFVFLLSDRFILANGIRWLHSDGERSRAEQRAVKDTGEEAGD